MTNFLGRCETLGGGPLFPRDIPVRTLEAELDGTPGTPRSIENSMGGARDSGGRGTPLTSVGDIFGGGIGCTVGWIVLRPSRE